MSFFPRLCAAFALLGATAALLHAAPSRNVVFITIDGLRWQEVFRGADEAFINTEFGGVPEKEVAPLRTAVLAPAAEERRAKLMPFLWGEVARQGQLFGNRDRESDMHVANVEWFSYPGYQEILCGFPDPLITSNAPIPNRNVTVLEWLNNREAFSGKVAACLTWHVLTATLNVGRARFPVWVSSQNPALAAKSARFADIDRWMRDIPIKSAGEHYDGFSFHAAREMLATYQPRVLYLALGEPDTNAHNRRYDAYLDSITRSDRFVRELWELLQSLDAYRGQTTLIVTTDHGRG
ncbi:MAG: alkaline phosphatase family protein, partial [Verrucomicrobiota bacterium]